MLYSRLAGYCPVDVGSFVSGGYITVVHPL